MRSYGIPEKLINIIKEYYKDFKCSVEDNGETSEWFEILTGVKQGCNMSRISTPIDNGLGNERNNRWKPYWNKMEIHIQIRRSRFC